MKNKHKNENKEFEVPLNDGSDDSDLSDSSNSSDSKENSGENNISDNERYQPQDLQTQNNSLKEQLLRKAAEFENYKRRTENEISTLFKYANEGLILELLPVLDDFERVNNSFNEKHDAETFKKGIELVYDKFNKILQKQGIKEIESKGKPFDVNLHEAIMQTPNDELEPNTIIDVAEKGYNLKDKVLRHAKVVVSKKSE